MNNTAPTPMLPQEKAAAVAHLRAALAFVEGMPVRTPCSECLNFSAGFCQHWKAQVPAEAQPAGCPQFDGLPF